ncbi:hypothetical protein GCM10009856_42680 [Mycolicibacterium llatzerense]
MDLPGDVLGIRRDLPPDRLVRDNCRPKRNERSYRVDHHASIYFQAQQREAQCTPKTSATMPAMHPTMATARVKKRSGMR